LEAQRKRLDEFECDVDTRIRPDSQGEGNQKTPQSRYWTAEEHQRFLEAIRKFGDKDVKAIASYVGSRNATQVRTHGQKYYLRLDREKRKKDEETRSESIVNGNQGEKFKSNGSKKKSQNTKRRKLMQSLGDSPQPPSTPKDASPRAAQTPVIPHFIQQQIAAETKDSVLAALRGWGSEEYNAFIEGLVTYSEEKDINVRCKLISENYLPTFTADEIKRCFTVLSNVAKAKERDEPHDEFANMEARAKADIFAHYQQTMKGSELPESVPYRLSGIPMRYPLPGGANFSHENFPLYGAYPPFINPERRASFPMDPSFVKQKHPDAADTFYPVDSGSWTSHSTNEVEFNQLDPNHEQL